ncbi:girdin-like isoform X2 [Tigriopus californicus]|uniref:girdin-like isoform X2 n=2 Tax=Tigriopus californicus TaxID=6832 RepID=UPI0027DA4365|nr:girdin-like isoform X2 [Tigriopus californicus]XP_059095124.1 girdin-like isoform X2 [Tigriopus californicus]
MEATKMETFLNGPLLQWLRTLPEAPAEITFAELTSGQFLHNVLQSFDANIPTTSPKFDSNPDLRARVMNINLLIEKLKLYYENILSQTIVIALPNTIKICQSPPTDQSLQEMDTLLLLLLGAAVQSSQKEHAVNSIQNLPVELQHAFVDKIKDVTDNPENIWPTDYDDPKAMTVEQKDKYYFILVKHVKKLVKQRDSFANQVMEIALQTTNLNEDALADPNSSRLTPEKNHFALEISESKSKVRKLNHQLEEKTEALMETKSELEKLAAQVAKLRQENIELTQDARAAKTYRDELDIVRDRANKADELEAEIQRYKDKVHDLHYYKTRVDEVQEDKRILVETKDMLEEQLTKARKRSDQVLSLEKEILSYKTALDKVQLDRESDKQRIDELTEENYALQMSTKSSFSESRSLLAEMQVLKTKGGKDTNIFTEQIGQDVTRVHRLELENQRLMSELENAKERGFSEFSGKILELEKENKRHSITIVQLQQQREKDEDYHAQLNNQLRRSESKIKELNTVVAALKEVEEQLSIEKNTEIDNLQTQVDSLRKRQESSQNEQLAQIQEENLNLIKERTHLQTQVNKLSGEKERLAHRVEDTQAQLNQAEDLKFEKEKLNSQLERVMKEAEDLRSLKDSYESSSDSFEKTRDENERLSKALDKLKTDKHNFLMDNTDLKRQVDLLNRKNQVLVLESDRIPSLENEREELKDTINKMRISMDTLEVSAKKSDELEQKLAALSSDNSRLKRQVESSAKKLEELGREHTTISNENKALLNNIQNLKTNAKNMEKMEKEFYDLDANHDKMKREHNSLTKEFERLTQAHELKEVTLIDLQSRVETLQRERDGLERELDQWKQDSSRIQDLEIERLQLVQSGSMDKRSLVKLREELVNEKLKTESLSNQLEGLNQQLRTLGIDQNILNGQDELISSERMKNLEGSMDQLLESQQKKIKGLESQLTVALKQKTNYQQQVETLELQIKAGDSQVGLEKQLSKVVKEKDQYRSELLELKMESSTNAEKIELYDAKVKKLNEDLVNIKVENSTLQSQSSSLLSQINHLQLNQNSLESAKRKSDESERRWKMERQNLLRDQVELQKLHDGLQQDYDNLLIEKDGQKEVEKALKADLAKLQSMSLSLSEGQDTLIKAKEALDQERENLRADARTLANLRSEHNRLKEDFRSLFTTNERVKGEYCNLQSDYKALKTSYNQLKLQQTDFKGQLDETRSQLTQVDVEYSKAMNRCEVLTKINNSLEDDRKGLMEQFSMLLSQYQELLTQTLNDKEHFHEEEKFYTDKMNHLSRQKEKLEEKIMEQYKRMDNSPQKKMGLGGTFVQKMKKYSLIPGNSRTSNSSQGNISGSGGSTSAASALSAAKVRSHTLNPISINRARSNSRGRLRTVEDAQDSSSVGSGCNDSLDSGSHSPRQDNLITRSESAHELTRRRESQNHKNSVAHLAIPPHLEEDSDGNHADNDSVNSLMSGASTFLTGTSDRYGESDHHHNHIHHHQHPLMQNQSVSSHSEVGLPLTSKTSLSRPGVTRILINGGEQTESNQRSSTPRLTSWKSTNSSPILGESQCHQDSSAPAVPARKPSRSGGKEAHPPPPLPQRPHKLQGGGGSSSSGSGSSVGRGCALDDNRYHQDDTDDSSTIDEEPSKQENTAWYEYGCV